MVSGRISQDSNYNYTLNLNNEGILFTIQHHHELDSTSVLSQYKSHAIELSNSKAGNTDLTYGSDPLTYIDILQLNDDSFILTITSTHVLDGQSMSE